MGRGGGREKKKETSERSRERDSPRFTCGLDTGAMGVQLRGAGGLSPGAARAGKSRSEA